MQTSSLSFNLSEQGFASYQVWARSRWAPARLAKSAPEIADLSVMALGLAGEAAEVGQVVERWALTGDCDQQRLTKELGDVLFYWARLADHLKASVAPEMVRIGGGSDGVPRMPPQHNAPVLEALALMSSAGSVAELVKKYIRDGHYDSQAFSAGLAKVFCAWSELCARSGLSCEQVLTANVQKLEDRAQRGTVRGSGDER